MPKYLQLYLDADYIIPIGIGENGNVNKYIDQQASRRLWLFFNRGNNGMFNANETNKANAEAGKEGYYGDFWKHLEDGDNVPGENYRFIELLDLAGIIGALRDWANATLFTDTPEVVLHFATVIPLKARRAFAGYIEQRLGRVRSYSKEIYDLLADKVNYDNRTMSPSFGDQMLVIQSSGNDILLSVQTWCGEQFMQGDDAIRLKKQGSEFLKYQLAKMVVDLYERNNNMLYGTEEKEREYRYQMQFAEVWLKEWKDETFWVERFHYSRNPGNIYPPIEIDGRQLRLLVEDAIRETIAAVRKYYKESIRNNHLHTVLMGDVFKDKTFLGKCVSETDSDGKYTYFDDNAVQEALGRYNVMYSSLEENLNDLERIYMDKANERERIREYVKNAEKIGKLRSDAGMAVRQLRDAYDSVTASNMNQTLSWETLMQHSQFDEAEKIIAKMSTSDSLTLANGKAFDTLKEIERNNSLLINLVQLREVRDIVEDIREKEEELRTYLDKTNQLQDMPDVLRRKVKKYRDLYPKYLEEKRLFESEPTLVAKRKHLEQMREMTMESLPVLDIEDVKGSVTVSVEKSGGFLGFGAKKTISMKLQIAKPLPCRGVLIISPKTITKIPEDRRGVVCFDVEKGAEDIVVDEKGEPSKFGLGKDDKTFMVKFWPHEDENVPINRFDIRGTGSYNL